MAWAGVLPEASQWLTFSRHRFHRYPVFCALHLPDVGVGEGGSYLWNWRSLLSPPPCLSSAHLKPPFRSSDPSTQDVWWMPSLFGRIFIDLVFFVTNTHGLCWVTHGCHLFKKPSTWIYNVTSGPRSPPHCQLDGEGWVLRILTGIKRKGNEFLLRQEEPYVLFL